MEQLLDLRCNQPTPKAQLDVKFSVPSAGWVKLWIRPLHTDDWTWCSEVWDPFADFIEWLELIATGAGSATWVINEEGYCCRLQFYGATIDDPNDYLAQIDTNDEGFRRVRAVIIERQQLIRQFYGAFRAMTCDPDYRAREWERHPLFPLTEEWDDDTYDTARAAHPFCGHPLRFLTSQVVEAYLCDEPDPQLALDLGEPWRSIS